MGVSDVIVHLFCNFTLIHSHTLTIIIIIIGGLGLRPLMFHAPAAYIASICSSGYGHLSLTHLTYAVEMFNECVAPADKISLDSIKSSNVKQKMLSSKLDDFQFQGLFNMSSVADRARLLSISASHSSS